MRRFVSSKLLLLQKVISDDNAANNGGGFNARKLCGPKRSANVLKLIPWEVYPALIFGSKMMLAGDLVASGGDVKSCSEEHDFKHSLNKSVTERSQMSGKQVVCRHNVYWRCDILENDKRSFRFEPFLDFLHDNIISQSHWYCQTQKLVLETP